MKFKSAAASNPPEPRNNLLRIVPFTLAGFVIVMLLAQLFTSEEFMPLFMGYGFDRTGAKLLAVAFYAAELFALPFWLGMRLSPLARMCSVVLGLLFPLGWLLLALIPTELASTGYFGSVVPVTDPTGKIIVALGLVASSVASFFIMRGNSVFISLKNR